MSTAGTGSNSRLTSMETRSLIKLAEDEEGGGATVLEKTVAVGKVERGCVVIGQVEVGGREEVKLAVVIMDEGVLNESSVDGVIVEMTVEPVDE